MRRLLAVAAVALAAASPAAAGTIRVAVASLADPSVAWSLDAHAVPDLCAPPKRPASTRWRLDCREAKAVAAALRARHLTVARHGRRLEVSTGFAWRRFPLLLRNLPVPGAPRFADVKRTATRIVATRPGLRLEFRKLGPYAGERAFLRHEVDAAPVPLGDIHAPQLAGSVRVRPLDAVDAVLLPPLPRPLLATYWSAANRADYVLLAYDGIAQPAFGLLHASPQPAATDYRDAKHRIKSLPFRRVTVSGDPARAAIVVANWRDLGLGPVVGAGGNARFVRLTPAYPSPEGIFLALQPRPGPLLRAALGAGDPLPDLRRLDTRLRTQARVVPIAWSVGAELVSPRLAGWRQDALGRTDYTRARR